jgi:hypothetical protein
VIVNDSRLMADEFEKVKIAETIETRREKSCVNVRGTARLTSAAIGEVLNRVCDVVIWLMG